MHPAPVMFSLDSSLHLNVQVLVICFVVYFLAVLNTSCYMVETTPDNLRISGHALQFFPASKTLVNFACVLRIHIILMIPAIVNVEVLRYPLTLHFLCTCCIPKSGFMFNNLSNSSWPWIGTHCTHMFYSLHPTLHSDVYFMEIIWDFNASCTFEISAWKPLFNPQTVSHGLVWLYADSIYHSLWRGQLLYQTFFKLDFA